MGIQFIFDTGSQHTFMAAQSVVYVDTNTTGQRYGFTSQITASPTGASSATYRAGNFSVLTDPANANNYSGLQIGCAGYAYHQGAGTMGSIYGIYGAASSVNSGLCTFIQGVVSNASLSLAGSATVARGMWSQVNLTGTASVGTLAAGITVTFSNTGSGNIAQVSLIQASNVINSGGGVIATLYGLDLPSCTAGTTNYAIRTQAGQVVLGDQLLVNGGLNLKRTTFSNALVNVVAADVVLAQIGTMTASRAVNLPAANAVPSGHRILVVDESGTVGAVNTLVINRAGADTINGLLLATLNSAYGNLELISDGVSKWTIVT